MNYSNTDIRLHCNPQGHIQPITSALPAHSYKARNMDTPNAEPVEFVAADMVRAKDIAREMWPTAKEIAVYLNEGDDQP